MLQNKDSLTNTFFVATTLCLVCAALVSAAAVVLKPIKNANILLDKRTNVLKVCGFTQEEIDAAGGVNKLFEDRFDTIIIDLETGEEAAEASKVATDKAGKMFGATLEEHIQNYDQIWCSKSKKEVVSDELSKSEDICGIKYRERYSHVFVLKSETSEDAEKYVFPVRSYGLWSMMQGYLAVEKDLKTVAGLTFYDQAETPGLGGEVMNPDWKAKWPEKTIFEGNVVGGDVILKVSKAVKDGEEGHTVDALSGATITSNGVTALAKYWMGEQGFGPFMKLRDSSGSVSAAGDNSTDNGSAESDNKKPAESGVNHGG